MKLNMEAYLVPESSSRQKGSPIDLYTIITPVLLFIGGMCASVLTLILENSHYRHFGVKKEEPTTDGGLCSTSTFISDGNHTSQLSINSVCS